VHTRSEKKTLPRKKNEAKNANQWFLCVCECQRGGNLIFFFVTFFLKAIDCSTFLAKCAAIEAVVNDD
jgi:hypothetical protein